jgi:hypothetical protein
MLIILNYSYFLNFSIAIRKKGIANRIKNKEEGVLLKIKFAMPSKVRKTPIMPMMLPSILLPIIRL